MPVTVEALQALFPKSDYGDFSSFEFDNAIGKFVGHVVHHEFRGLAVPERQERIWKLFRETFGEEANEISLVLTYSPEEWEEISGAA